MPNATQLRTLPAVILATFASALYAPSYASAAEAVHTPARSNLALAKSYTLQSFDTNGKTSYSSITEDLQNPYFFSNCFDAAHCYKNVPVDAVIFKVPSGFDTTPNSDHPRSELRAKQEFTAGQNFVHGQSGTAYIVENPTTKSIIFAQIHGDKVGGSEMFKLRWEDGSVLTGIKQNYADKEKFDTLFQDVKLNEPISYKLTATGSQTGITVTLNISVDGKSVDKTYHYPPASWDGIALYFKAGNYNQDSTRGGPDAVVAYSGLDVN